MERRNSTESSLIGEIFKVEKSIVEISREKIEKFGIDTDLRFGEWMVNKILNFNPW